MSQLKAPFPWFGGKSRAAHLVWERFGDVRHYIEPFFGSGAVLLARPESHRHSLATVNDLDGFVANFWRAVKADPDGVAAHADWPVNEVDFHARHLYLVGQRHPLEARLRGDPEFYDLKIAGWWVWGIALQIGSDFVSGKGPWRSVDGVFCKAGNAGRGIHKEMPHISNAGQGIHKKMPHIGDAGRGIAETFREIEARLRRVRVLTGDWSRAVKSRTVRHPVRHGKSAAITGIFLDPPYLSSNSITYASEAAEDLGVGEWCLKHGGDPRLRIALCGYDGEYDLPGWTVVAWKAQGGHSNRSKDNDNATKERIWFSPHCLKPGTLLL